MAAVEEGTEKCAGEMHCGEEKEKEKERVLGFAAVRKVKT